MKLKLILGGLYGLVMGAIAGSLFFDSIPGMLGVGCAMAACMCGAIIAAAWEDDRQ